MVSSIIKVCPKAEELSVVRVNIPCPVDGCSSILPHSGSLQIHLSKTHRITGDSNGTSSEDSSDQNAVKHYHCPVQKCVYNISSERHFTSKKLLRQHYMKIHAEKKHKCPKCGHGFGLERDCQRHLLTCGIIFRCKTCDCPFSSVEATKNHCKIKQHQIPDECKNIRSTNKTPSCTAPQTILILQTVPPNTSLSPIIKNQSSQLGTSLRPLLPKPVINPAIFPAPKIIKTTEMTTSNPLLIAPFVKSASAVAVASQSINIQADHDKNNMNLLTLAPSLTPVDTTYLHKTNPPQRPKYCRNIAQTDCTFSANSGRKVGKRPSKNSDYSLHKFTSSTGIQTAVSVPPVKKKSHCNMVGTQTVGDYILTAAMTSAQIPIHRISQGSQVYPRGKQRIQKSHSVESSHTQTIEMKSARWKKRRRASSTHQDNCDEISSENATSFVLCSPGEVMDNHTQTLVTDSAPAISTQTHMTCLVNSSATENGSAFSTQQSAETQTTRSVLQHATMTTTKNVNGLYRMPNTYNPSDDAQPVPLSVAHNSNNSNDGNSSCKKSSDDTRLLLKDNMTSTMQTEPDISLIYSSLTNEPVSTNLTNHLTSSAFPSFADDLTDDIEDRNCTSLLNAGCHTSNNFECENTTMERPISNPSQLPVRDHDLVKVKEVICETNAESPFGNFISPNLNTECSLPGFSNGNSLNQFQSLEIQKPEEDKRKHSESNCATNNNLLCSLVDKDPILCSNTAFTDIGDSNDVLMGPFDNNRNFTSTSAAHLEITDSSLLNFQKGICTTDDNDDSESFLLEPSKTKSETNNLNAPFFHSLLDKHPNTHSKSNQVNASSSMDTESSFASDQLCLNDTRTGSDSCTTKLYSHEKNIGTNPCHSSCLGMTSASNLYNVSSNVLTNSPERRSISTRMDELMDESQLSHDSCTSLITNSFAPLMADIEVQTLALDTDFEALLNNSEHSRSSSSAIDMYTQTVEDMLDLFGNNTETQTTVEDTFFQGLEFTDIETQTTSGELDCLETCSLITSGTQTTLSNQNLNKDVEFSDMETQTGFNVCDLDTFLTDSHTQTTFDELVDFLSGLNS